MTNTTQTTQTPKAIASFGARYGERFEVIPTPSGDYGVFRFDNEDGTQLGQPMFFAVAANATEWARMKAAASFGRGSATLVDCPDQGAAK